MKVLFVDINIHFFVEIHSLEYKEVKLNIPDTSGTTHCIYIYLYSLIICSEILPKFKLFHLKIQQIFTFTRMLLSMFTY